MESHRDMFFHSLSCIDTTWCNEIELYLMCFRCCCLSPTVMQCCGIKCIFFKILLSFFPGKCYHVSTLSKGSNLRWGNCSEVLFGFLPLTAKDAISVLINKLSCTGEHVEIAIGYDWDSGPLSRTSWPLAHWSPRIYNSDICMTAESPGSAQDYWSGGFFSNNLEKIKTFSQFRCQNLR
jgi:hypothetical protein